MQDVSSLPKPDQFRLQTISLIYAAALGYGFSVWDFNNIKPDNIYDWFEILFYIATLGVVATDYAFVNELYIKEHSYDKNDFFLDIAIVFCFTRMLDNAPELYKDNVPNSFRWWMWFGIVFLLYFVWDIFRCIKNTPQKYTLIADGVMTLIAFVYLLLSVDPWWFHKGVFPFFFAFIFISLYVACVWVWRYEALKE